VRTDKITANHLQRAAIVYVRQSSPEQVRNHAESTRIQLGLRDKAITFGWRDPVTIMDDLGISAGGFAHRAGFQHMAAEVSLGHVGIILCFEASQLSRNSKDWAQLFEICGHLNTLVADLDQVYDLALPDDRLILGVKGSVSEYELSLFRQRSQQAIVAKAKRGALTFTLPAGLSWTPDGQIELHPDRRVQHAIHLVLDKLSKFGSVRQVLMWLRDENVSLPTLESERPRAITWRLPTYRMVLSIVRSPFYAGAYAFGRRESRTRVVDGRATRTAGHAKPMAQWTSLIRDHHPGYIRWEQFERNQRLLEENTHMKGTMARKAGRGGQCLLAGLLRCARCGRMLHVMYGRRGYARYECRQANRAEAAPRCIAFSARRPDETVTAEILTVVQGSALAAAIEAGDLAEQQYHDQHRALALELEQATYHATLAARRYEAVDPANRLVAAELEARWDAALERVTELEGRLTTQGRVAPRSVPVVDRETLESLATDLRSVWEAPSSEMRVKQRIARLLIHEIIANTDEDTREIVLVIHWAGGRHSEVRLPRPKAGDHRHRTGPDAEGVVRRMAGAWPDHDIAATLNRLRLRTGAGNTWTASRVSSLRQRLRLVDYDETRATPMLTLNQAADRLGVGSWVLRGLIACGLLQATQVVPCAPWQLDPAVLDTDAIRTAAKDVVQGRHRRPGSRIGDSHNLEIPGI
jgi:DNA invertase Pin-like site-specific DNA recombinase